jgi:DNA primase
MDGKDVDADVVARYNVRWDAKGKCWLLPIYTFDNQLAGWQEKSKGYFMNVPKQVKKSESLFGWHTFRSGQLVVVESPLDAMRFATYGYPAVATYGSFISDAQLEHLLQSEKLILAFDNDDAGDHATEQVSQALRFLHPWIRVFKYPPRSRGKDPGELAPAQLIDGVSSATIPTTPATTKEHINAHRHRRPQGRKVPHVW